MSHKLVIFWLAGGLFLLAGSWIMGNLDLSVGISTASYYMAVVTSLVLYLLAGLCWIAVAAAAKGHWKF
ncbi:MAG: hypothetical protein JW789_04465 [Candidatus Aenigmarchaeota archaeon]|nr:hypothetical protein [Candidatus Aenigmarchaeota archaeon]